MSQTDKLLLGSKIIIYVKFCASLFNTQIAHFPQHKCINLKRVPFFSTKRLQLKATVEASTFPPPNQDSLINSKTSPMVTPLPESTPPATLLQTKLPSKPKIWKTPKSESNVISPRSTKEAHNKANYSKKDSKNNHLTQISTRKSTSSQILPNQQFLHKAFFPGPSREPTQQTSIKYFRTWLKSPIKQQISQQEKPQRLVRVQRAKKVKKPNQGSKRRDYSNSRLCDQGFNLTSIHANQGNSHQVHKKKENLLSAQNLNNQPCNKNQDITRQHKRHFSNIVLQANKENIERRQNGICIKEDMTDKKKHQRKEFNHDFYKKEYRMKLNTKRDQCIRKETNINLKIVKNEGSNTNRAHRKTQHHESHQQGNKMAELRKRFL